MRRQATRCAALAAAVLWGGAAMAAGPVKPYLEPSLLPSGEMILPPPPRAGSVAAMLDAQMFLDSRSIKQQDPRRWALATREAALDAGRLPSDFGCALGVTPDLATTPWLYRLLGRTAETIQPVIEDAQKHFARPRPYLHNHQPICVPRFTKLDHSPSYPSGSAALGWSAALILAELAPDRSHAILAHGRELADSRVVCGVHWFSDVQAAALDAAGLVAVLHSSADFRADLDAARLEIEAARKRPSAAHADVAACAAEQPAASDALPSHP